MLQESLLNLVGNIDGISVNNTVIENLHFFITAADKVYNYNKKTIWEAIAYELEYTDEEKALINQVIDEYYK